MQPRSLRTLSTVALVCFGIFIILALILASQGSLYDSITAVDTAYDKGMSSLRSSSELTVVMLIATYLGNPEIIIALELCLLALIILVHRKRIAALFLGGIIAGELLSLIFKNLLERTRPEEILFQVSRIGYSFPSGHALLGTVFYGCLGFFAAHIAKKQSHKIMIWIATALIVFLIGYSRIFLGVHWLSDVVGGWLLGIACVAAIMAFFYRIHTHTQGESMRKITSRETTAVIVVTIMVGFFVVYYFVTRLPEIRSIV